MAELDSDAFAWYSQGGVELVNSMLKVEYRSPIELRDALQLLEASGNWRILWHHQSMRPDDSPDFGVVIEYLGDDD